MDFGHGRKRGRQEGTGFNGNASFKRNRQETESFSGIGSKSKPCTKFFSTAGCPFGEGCHFLHHVPGGITAVAQMTNMGGGNPAYLPRNPMGGPPDVPSPPSAKTKMCKNFNTAEGCKFGDKCHFAHGERELSTPFPPSREDPRAMGRFGSGRPELDPQAVSAAASFGASATAKISVDASLAGAIIGKGGVNSKEICRITGAKLSIREHESESNLRNIELEGTFDQIKQASAMVRELIVNVSSTANARHINNPHAGSAPVSKTPANNFKTKLCENFSKGACTFGEKCHFAHGAAELRKQGP
ncbi:hypothetical protein ACHQM5_018535 [Ranunculus cassubicifolius]